ncbi:glutamine amidotransferase [freshwater metagenome]|uniref:glutaminase n=1 Tax=freshwater metagenome TaxID=449393 RepID=A0A094SBW9_9ZZZZ
MRVGVFALQGDVREHLQLLTSLGVESIEVRNADQLASCDGLIIPGGESTTISKLIDIFGLRDDLLAYIAKGSPVYGTCAGMIMLATQVLDEASGQQSLKAMDISVRRNAFGSQLDSFEVSVEFAASPVEVAFIRAPIVERVGENVQVLSKLSTGAIVAVREGNLLATSFHPELTGDSAVHEYFLGMISKTH